MPRLSGDFRRLDPLTVRDAGRTRKAQNLVLGKGGVAIGCPILPYVTARINTMSPRGVSLSEPKTA